MTRYIIRKYLCGDRPDGRKKAGIILGAAVYGDFSGSIIDV